MRDNIVLYLKQQKPKCIYHKDEHKGVFSYYSQIWLDNDNRVCSIFVIYNPVTLLNCKTEGQTLFESLDNLVQIYDTYSSAVVNINHVNVRNFTNTYLVACNSFEKIILNRVNLVDSNFKVLNFNCIDYNLGIYTLLYSVNKHTDFITIIAGKTNYIECSYDKLLVQDCLDKLFGELVKIIVVNI